MTDLMHLDAATPSAEARCKLPSLSQGEAGEIG
jgi:hypothetical protein